MQSAIRTGIISPHSFSYSYCSINMLSLFLLIVYFSSLASEFCHTVITSLHFIYIDEDTPAEFKCLKLSAVLNLLKQPLLSRLFIWWISSINLTPNHIFWAVYQTISSLIAYLELFHYTFFPLKDFVSFLSLPLKRVGCLHPMFFLECLSLVFHFCS